MLELMQVTPNDAWHPAGPSSWRGIVTPPLK